MIKLLFRILHQIIAESQIVLHKLYVFFCFFFSTKILTKLSIDVAIYLIQSFVGNLPECIVAMFYCHDAADTENSKVQLSHKNVSLDQVKHLMDLSEPNMYIQQFYISQIYRTYIISKRQKGLSVNHFTNPHFMFLQIASCIEYIFDKLRFKR